MVPLSKVVLMGRHLPITIPACRHWHQDAGIVRRTHQYLTASAHWLFLHSCRLLALTAALCQIVWVWGSATTAR
jgi:hypothetical protein